MSGHAKLDPDHAAKRRFLRVLGPLLILVGLICLVSGFKSTFVDGPSRFMARESPFPGQSPGFDGMLFRQKSSSPFGRFWLMFVGMPLLGIGVIVTVLGYKGAVARYAAGELAPVAKDTVNYMANGTRDSVRTIASAIGEGLRGSAAGADSDSQVTVVRCHKCNAENDSGAKFCSQCGAALQKSKACLSCNELNDPDARFCDNCGKGLA